MMNFKFYHIFYITKHCLHHNTRGDERSNMNIYYLFTRKRDIYNLLASNNKVRHKLYHFNLFYNLFQHSHK